MFVCQLIRKIIACTMSNTIKKMGNGGWGLGAGGWRLGMASGWRTAQSGIGVQGGTHSAMQHKAIILSLKMDSIR